LYASHLTSGRPCPVSSGAISEDYPGYHRKCFAVHGSDHAKFWGAALMI
jgi:hypothetical protein